MNLSGFKEGKLLRGNMPGENRSETIGNNLINDLVKIVAQRYRFLIIKILRRIRLRDESDKSRVDGMI